MGQGRFGAERAWPPIVGHGKNVQRLEASTPCGWVSPKRTIFELDGGRLRIARRCAETDDAAAVQRAGAALQARRPRRHWEKHTKVPLMLRSVSENTPPCQSSRACWRDTRASSTQKARLRAAPQHHRQPVARAMSRLVRMPQSGGCLRARLVGHQLRRRRPWPRRSLARLPLAAEQSAHAPARHGRAGASSRGCENAPGRRGLEAGVDLLGDQGLVVAGMVEQACRDVDRVTETVAPHLDDLATRQRHLQAQAAQAGRGTMRAAALAPGSRAPHASAALPAGHRRSPATSNTAIKPVAQRLDRPDRRAHAPRWCPA